MNRITGRTKEVILTNKAFRILGLYAYTDTSDLVENFMSEQTAAQREMAELLVEALNLEDITAAEIQPDEPLFGDGLGLDSIDALEIALAISQKYGVQMQAEDENTRNSFATLSALTEFVEQNKS